VNELEVNAEIPNWAVDFYQTDIRYKVAYGGRGSGKSWGFALLIVLKMMQSPIRVLCARELQTSMRESVHQLISETIKRIGAQEAFNVLESEITCTLNGSSCIFKGLKGVKNDASALKSFEGIDICWIEEAQTVSRESLETLKPTIRKQNSEIWITFNPLLATDPVYVDYVVNTPKNALVRKVNYSDNPWFADTALPEDMAHMKATDYERYRHVWEGECVTHTDAQVFKGKWRVDDFETPEGVVFYFGADWGFSVDPTTLIRCFIHDGSLYIDYEAYAVGCEIDHLPALFDTVPESRRYIIRADSALPATISYMQRRGFKMQAVKKGAGSVEDGIVHLRGYNEIIIHGRCIKTAEEFLRYSYKTDKLTGDVQPVLEDKWNHCIDALRYAVEPLIKSSQPVALSYTSSKARYR
jgi:phage terminase large subunit